MNHPQAPVNGAQFGSPAPARPLVEPIAEPPAPALPVRAAPWGLLPRTLEWLVGQDPARRAVVKTRIVQVLVLLNVVLGTRYILWRSFVSVNWAVWWFGLTLLAAELFSYTDSLLFGMNMWRVRSRGAPPPAPPGLTVDVFVTTYNEPIELVRATAIAARDLRYPHHTWVLDDGNRPAMRRCCEELGVGYLTRDDRWTGKARHAKAGNLVNALHHTAGEFLLILDADQVPQPELLDRTLGYFGDPTVAFVQTPQWFHNTPPGDPFGTDAPLFYGPIQAGKDGWNSAFFCGSNAVLRREALMQIGVVWYARELDRRVRRALRAAGPLLRRARRRVADDLQAVLALDEVLGAVNQAKRALRAGRSLQDVTWHFQRSVEQVSRRMVLEDLRRIREVLHDTPGLGPAELPTESTEPVVRAMSLRTRSPLAAIDEVRQLVLGVDVDRAEEAEAVFPISTVSVTEDMATAMRLHGLGWRSVYHHEILAEGVAPEDLGTMMQQRLRWAQGTLQVMLRENPLWQPGLTIPQRLLYFGTMWSYLSGFAAVVYLLSPVMFLIAGLTPVRAYSAEFFGYLLPWLVVNQLLFVVIGWGLPTWRGQQYSVALFPLWIRATWTAFANVFLGRELGFVVTPKTRQAGPQARLVWPQLVIMALLLLAVLVGLGELAFGDVSRAGPVMVNVAWASYNLAMLSVVLGALRVQRDQ